MINTVIRAANDMVIVFDEHGNQMPDYQGQYQDVKKKIISDTGKSASYINWFGISPQPDVISKVNW